MGKFIYDEEDDYIINRPENDNRTSIKNIKQNVSNTKIILYH